MSGRGCQARRGTASPSSARTQSAAHGGRPQRPVDRRRQFAPHTQCLDVVRDEIVAAAAEKVAERIFCP